MSRIAVVFPGQGAQKIGMGKDFYEHSQCARYIYDKSSELLNLDMKQLCFEQNEQLDITEYTQAALVTTCLAMYEVMKERGLTAEVAAGLSLGEYCALVATGGMRTEDAILTVRERGILMQEAVPQGVGAMAAVMGLEADAIEQVLCNLSGVTIANYNCPGQIVITGACKSVELAATLLKEQGAKRVVLLNVSGPFHSPLLEVAGVKLGEVLEHITLSQLQIPYVANVTGKYVYDSQETKPLLATQVASSVKWQQSVETMIEQGIDTFIEIGPGRTLTSFIKKINREVKTYQVGMWEDVEKVIGECVC